MWQYIMKTNVKRLELFKYRLGAISISKIIIIIIPNYDNLINKKKSNLNTNLKFGTYIANMFDNVGVKFQKFWFSSFLVIEQSSRLSVQPS